MTTISCRNTGGIANRRHTSVAGGGKLAACHTGVSAYGGLMKTEIWKDRPGYEGRYQASSLGRIKSLKRKVRSVNRYSGMDFLRTVPERILRPGQHSKCGHVSVVLEHGGNGKQVHRLVMLAFKGRPPVGCEALHINGNPKDNRLVNLRYGTRTENILDIYKHRGRYRKLTTEDVDAIRFSLFCGVPGNVLALEYGVSQSTISSIKHGRTYWWHQ
jgi:hypothetical protein